MLGSPAVVTVRSEKVVCADLFANHTMNVFFNNIFRGQIIASEF